MVGYPVLHLNRNVHLSTIFPMSIWQPIKTAPKDMSQVLGYVEESVVVMWWFTYADGRAYWETVDGESEVDPTHWMPLPNPPHAKEGKPSA